MEKCATIGSGIGFAATTVVDSFGIKELDISNPGTAYNEGRFSRRS